MRHVWLPVMNFDKKHSFFLLSHLWNEQQYLYKYVFCVSWLIYDDDHDDDDLELFTRVFVICLNNISSYSFGKLAYIHCDCPNGTEKKIQTKKSVDFWTTEHL